MLLKMFETKAYVHFLFHLPVQQGAMWFYSFFFKSRHWLGNSKWEESSSVIGPCRVDTLRDWLWSVSFFEAFRLCSDRWRSAWVFLSLYRSLRHKVTFRKFYFTIFATDFNTSTPKLWSYSLWSVINEGSSGHPSLASCYPLARLCKQLTVERAAWEINWKTANYR